MNTSKFLRLTNAGVGLSALACLTALSNQAVAATDAECLALLGQPGIYASGILSDPYRGALGEFGSLHWA